MEELDRMWEELGDIPINKKDEIDTDTNEIVEILELNVERLED